ncbi:MAG: methyltransferase domain-containing protein [bacterium]
MKKHLKTGSQNKALVRWQQALDRSVSYRRLITGADEKYWEQFSENYFQNRTSGPHYQEVLERILKEIPKGDTLIEIGPGPGIFTLALITHVGWLTAVEPSPAAVNVLRSKTAHFDNLRIVNHSWEEAVIEPHDVVFAAGVLYVFYHLEAALRKMIHHARQEVLLVTLHDEQPMLNDIARVLNPSTPASDPSPDLILDVLRNITTSFSYEKLNGRQIYHYPSLAAWLNLWTQSMALTPEQLSRIKECLEAKGGFVHDNGEVILPRELSTHIITIYP